MALNVCIADADAVEMRYSFYKKSPLNDLIDIAEHGGFIDDVPAVLCELRNRGYTGTVQLAENILDRKKGDRFLWEWVVDFLYEDYGIAREIPHYG